MTTLYRFKPEANMARFYAFTIQPTLFGEWALVREWGRIGRRPQCCPQEAARLLLISPLHPNLT